ncbi:MAG: thioredoxin domain-containing protein [bacterium]|nr:thioredoxin domain-containing protein [bacterium]
MNEESSKTKTELSVPVAIIIAGIIIAVSIVATKGATSPAGGGLQYEVNGGSDNNAPLSGVEPIKPTDIKLRPVSNEDHIRGSLDSTVKFVVYSDTECPFCKRFHSTMNQVMDSYSKNNKVAWVYRHFPLDALHSKARKESEALECANELGGNDKFWAYLDRLMEVTPSNNQLDSAELPKIAEFVKLDKTKFQTCLSSGRYAAKVQMDVDDASSAGGRGTPYSVIISATGKKYPIDGALPYESLKVMVDTALRDK